MDENLIWLRSTQETRHLNDTSPVAFALSKIADAGLIKNASSNAGYHVKSERHLKKIHALASVDGIRTDTRLRLGVSKGGVVTSLKSQGV